MQQSKTAVLSGDGERPRAAVLAIVRRDGRLLLGRRQKTPDLGLWGFPGGRLEWGETLEAAACRELAEETAVMARPLCRAPPLEIIRPIDDVHVILCPILCRWEAGEGHPADGELAAIAWMDAAVIAGLGSGTFSRDLPQLAAWALAQPWT